MINTNFVWGESPSISGWYATLHCWDPDEGIIPSAHYWNGEKWLLDHPIVAHFGPFENETIAFEWAYAHDFDINGKTK